MVPMLLAMSQPDPTSPSLPLADALARLDECDRIVERLHKMCCEPGRSPRMEKLAGTIATARAQVESLDGDLDGQIALVIDTLEDAGAQLGHLQVGCCAPARMPLYADVLEGLTEIQLNVHKAAGQAHH